MDVAVAEPQFQSFVGDRRFVAEVFAAFVRLQGPTPAMIVPPIGSKGNRSHPISLITTRVVTINDSP